MDNSIEVLQAIVGHQYVLTDNQDLEPYVTPWRGQQGKALFVVLPKDTNEVSKVIAYLYTQKISFITQTGNTGLVHASTPDQTGNQAVLSLKRLKKIQDINTVNNSAHLEAGVTLSSLNQVLKQHDLFFPIDLSSDPCIGGMVATNTGGSRLFKYGDVRKNLLGLKVVLRNNEGTVIDLIHNLHKNNTGLDLKQLFIGNSDANAIITECVVKLSPRPKQNATALIIPNDITSIPTILKILERTYGDELSAFEGISKNALETVFINNKQIKNGFGKNLPNYVCLIELSRTWDQRHNEISLEDVIQTELTNIIAKNKNLIHDVLFGHASDHWELRHAVSESVQKSGKLISFDISFSRDKAIHFLDFIYKQLPKTFDNIKICDFGHIGDGAMHLNLVVSSDDYRLQKPSFIKGLREWVLDIVVKDFQGSFSAEHGVGPLNIEAYKKYTPNTIQMITKQLGGYLQEL